MEAPPGTRRVAALPLAALPDHTPMTLNVQVVHGKRPGPVFFVSGVVHGDEIIGLEIIRRLLKAPALAEMRGTLLAIPLVNVFGFINRNRYMPDRRDLNRCFPGSESGALGERLAWLFSTHIIERCDAGVDIHSASNHRENLPQIRVDRDSEDAAALAAAFGASLVLTAPLRPGSLRACARAAGKPVLLYEAGEALRFDETSVRIGVTGILNVMAQLGMIPESLPLHPKYRPVFAHRSHWVRAPLSGVFRAAKALGDGVEVGEELGVVSDPMGDSQHLVVAHRAGLVIGRSVLPVVNRGDALFHIAEASDPEHAEAAAAAREEAAAQDTLFDEDEIV